ncbi:class A beta-lactamase [Ancylobacter mangrovi]|uniref:class A beta-lactamase n=1 Tax=Ancylobacter mangrovi TaxID=2972472 RepID=UPI0021625F29|nr:class A beta-lactamase [Ancylobacter mangrovi]MCS0503575.1 class A beta-lactamase [Ancylobacter mangrovi]
MRIDRRQLVTGGLAALALPSLARPAGAAVTGPSDLIAALQAIERKAGGAKLGVCIIDCAWGTRVGYRADERFPLLSSFKLLAGAAVLERVDAHKNRLDGVVAYGKDDLVAYSPATEKHAGEGMSLGAICEAAITLSDNTAGNLMLKTIGGPEGLTAFARRIGDETSRLDRWETALNDVKPGDRRDTTSPAAMAEDVRRLVTGDVLQPGSRQQLADWLIASQTGGKRLRAGLPKDWKAGDKTGTTTGAANDVAIAWPPDRAPVVIAAYMKEVTLKQAETDAVFASVAQVAADFLTD